MESLIILNEYQVATLKEYYGDKYEKKVTKKVKKYIKKIVAKADEAIDNMYDELDGLDVEVMTFEEMINNMTDEEKWKFFDDLAEKINKCCESECNCK